MTAAQQHRIKAIGVDGAELARYRVSSGHRVLLGRRTPMAGTAIVDLPLDGDGPRYSVDRGLHDPAAIAALLEDYLEQAECFDACPMSSEAIGAMLRCPEPGESASDLSSE
jgi:hypothetical protein